MKVKIAEEPVINKLFKTEHTLESTQEELLKTKKELLKAKETIRELREGVDAIAETAFLCQDYIQSEGKGISRISFNSVWSDSLAYYTILNILKTSEKFYIDE